MYCFFYILYCVRIIRRYTVVVCQSSQKDHVQQYELHHEKTSRGGGGRLLINCVLMREQRTAKLTLNSVLDILKLIPLFTVPSEKVALSSVVNKNAYSLTSATFVNFVKKKYKFPTKIAFFLP